MAGQIAELADHTLKGAFRHIDSTQARMILIDGADAVLPPMGPKLGRRRSAGWRRWASRSSSAPWSPTSIARHLTVKHGTGPPPYRIATKVWSAGVSASPLGKEMAAQSGAELDRGRPGQGAARPDHARAIRTSSWSAT
jgi:NADH dehydrogenase